MRNWDMTHGFQLEKCYLDMSARNEYPHISEMYRQFFVQFKVKISSRIISVCFLFCNPVILGNCFVLKFLFSFSLMRMEN